MENIVVLFLIARVLDSYNIWDGLILFWENEVNISLEMDNKEKENFDLFKSLDIKEQNFMINELINDLKF